VSYHDLSDCTLTDYERREEATRICRGLDMDPLSDTENAFVRKMWDERVPVSVKQLFWLRDINTKY